jgi:hypothetical protein
MGSSKASTPPDLKEDKVLRDELILWPVLHTYSPQGFLTILKVRGFVPDASNASSVVGIQVARANADQLILKSNA